MIVFEKFQQVKSDDYTNGCLLDCDYFNKYILVNNRFK